jgi:hypothetical protein
MTRNVYSGLFVALMIATVLACGGAGGRKPNANVGAPPPEDKLDRPIVKFVPTEPEPIFVFKKEVLPLRKFNPITSQLQTSSVDKVGVSITNAAIKDGLLLIKLAIRNHGFASLPYEPWNSASGKISPASDEHGNSFEPRPVPAAFGKAIAATVQLTSGQAVTEYIAFDAPPRVSQEVDFRLPGRNASLPIAKFAFKINRAFFAKEEDARLDAADEVIQRQQFKIQYDDWVARMELAKQQAIAKADAEFEKQKLALLARQEAERQKRAEIAAEAQRKASEIHAAKQQRVKDNLDRFMRNIDQASKVAGANIVKHVVVEGNATTVTVTVPYTWHDIPRGAKLSFTSALWSNWVSIASPDNHDGATLHIVDPNGDRVGGRSVWSGVWVQ